MTSMRCAAHSTLGFTLVEILVALAIMSMMVASVWNGFKGTVDAMQNTERVQQRYSMIRNGLNRMTSEISMAYLSGSRPGDETRHFTMFEGRDSSTSDSLTFSSFAHLRVRKDADESDQTVIQYFLGKDSKDSMRTHLYRRETRRLMGDLPERMEEYWPAYILCEDVVSLDFKYWNGQGGVWLDEWATMRSDAQPDRLPHRVKIQIGVREPDGTILKFTNQTVPFMQEKIDLGLGG